ncbi:uncharacterized protein SCHCODRAFT_02693279 [Schizophyllum commune H4-8]|nr:uncharacterized protein SCHCODRAFT_02693279 [Schizophyllum commune H4-8]KAI5886562.1 hypothetical protein SCHCODRAFT_02693279 [Schizophyllum commune H4-8]
MSGTRSSSRVKALHDQKAAHQDMHPTVATRGAQASAGRLTKLANSPANKTFKAPTLKARPANKRRKVAKANGITDNDARDEGHVKGKFLAHARKLQQITGMPLDILFEIFKLCAKCTEPMSYPRALLHTCLFASEQEIEEDNTTISLATMLASCDSAVTPFYYPDSAGSKVHFDEEAS